MVKCYIARVRHCPAARLLCGAEAARVTVAPEEPGTEEGQCFPARLRVEAELGWASVRRWVRARRGPWAFSLEAVTMTARGSDACVRLRVRAPRPHGSSQPCPLRGVRLTVCGLAESAPDR